MIEGRIGGELAAHRSDSGPYRDAQPEPGTKSLSDAPTGVDPLQATIAAIDGRLEATGQALTDLNARVAESGRPWNHRQQRLRRHYLDALDQLGDQLASKRAMARLEAAISRIHRQETES